MAIIRAEDWARVDTSGICCAESGGRKRGKRHGQKTCELEKIKVETFLLESSSHFMYHIVVLVLDTNYGFDPDDVVKTAKVSKMIW
jgi:hypothetical protein